MLRWIVLLGTLLLLLAGCDHGDDESAASASSPRTEVEPCPPPADPDPRLRAAGSVAFAIAKSEGSELVVVEARTRTLRRVTRQRSAHDGVGSLAWSPDGARIAYSGGTDGWNDNAYDDIWVVDVRGRPPKRLTNSREDDWNPVWSPGGKQIAFDRQDDGYNWIYVVNQDGTALRRLTPDFSWHPAWSPDGRISYVDGRGIWVMNADGSNKRLLARAELQLNDPAPLAWAPDGSHLAFTTETALWVVRADGTGRRKLFGVGRGSARSPTWSPDSTKVAWQQGDGDLEIYVVNRDGSRVRNVTDNERVNDQSPSWSPSGRALSFLRTCLGGPREHHRATPVVMNLDGSAAGSLSSLPLEQWPSAPAWSP